MSVCPKCGSPIKIVPAGFSKKTGKSYNAFEACSNRDCTWKPERKASQAQSYGAPQAAPQIGVMQDIAHELQEIKSILLKIAFQSSTDKAQPKTTVAKDELAPDEEIPF